jgi:hypothetical protein
MWGVAFPQPYLQLYNASAAAIKSVNQSFRVGGPATMQVERRSLVCKLRNVPPRAADNAQHATRPAPPSGRPASRTHPAAVRGAREAADAIH